MGEETAQFTSLSEKNRGHINLVNGLPGLASGLGLTKHQT